MPACCNESSTARRRSMETLHPTSAAGVLHAATNNVRLADRCSKSFVQNSVRVAVDALHEVNVMRALCGFERCIHHLDVDTAIGKLGMAGGAGGSRLLSMTLVAGEATESLVNAGGCAVVPAANFHAHKGRMALVAERLA